jgi:hypothetical protein
MKLQVSGHCRRSGDHRRKFELYSDVRATCPLDLTRKLEERGEELGAARAANREMIAQMNTGPRKNATPGSSHNR